MLAPAAMKHVNILVLARDIKQVTEALGHMRILHLTEEEPDSKRYLQRASREEEIVRTTGLARRVESLLLRLHVEPGAARPMRGYASLDNMEKAVEEVEQEANKFFQKDGIISEEIARLEALLSDLEAFEGLPARIEQIEESLFLHFAIGYFPEAQLPRLKEATGPDAVLIPYQDADGRERIISVTSKKKRWALEAALARYAFKPEDLAKKYQGIPGEILERSRKRLGDLKREEEALFLETKVLREKYGPLLLFLDRRLAIEEKVLRAEEAFPKTWVTYFISGWVPTDKVDFLARRLRMITANKAIIESRDPVESELKSGTTPVLFRNWSLLKPFELLTTAYGIPAYGEVEPTMLLALSFILMFGAMFGDVGQGGLLVLLGLLIWRYAKAAKARDAGIIIGFAGGSSVVFGFLYGSVFSKEGLIPALWVHPLKDIYGFLRASIVLGAAMISLGVILNIINRFRTHHYLEGILDKFGLVGGIFYWGALGLVIKYFILGRGPVTWEIVLLLVVPLLVLLFREPIVMLLVREQKPTGTGLATAFMEGIVDVLETFIVYVANTASFLRVGAFALAHAGLSLAIFSIVATVRDATAGALWAALAIVFGNIVIVLLEGLVVSIQAIRLEYYEFFSKFFRGTGKRFQPFEI